MLKECGVLIYGHVKLKMKKYVAQTHYFWLEEAQAGPLRCLGVRWFVLLLFAMILNSDIGIQIHNRESVKPSSSISNFLCYNRVGYQF